VARALEWASAAIACTVYSLSHTRARVAATQRGVRIAGMSSLTEHAFAEALPIDYPRLARAVAVIATALEGADICRLTSAAGTELTLRLGGRSAIADDGNLRNPGAFGNLPAGEAYIAPVESFSEGVIVCDGSLAGYGLLAHPLTLHVSHGNLIEAQGEGSDWLLTTLAAGGNRGRVMAELGIGVNPGAQLTGISIVDEKTAGTAHIAFGTNTSFGGENAADVHIDAILREPSIDVDGTMLIDRGRPEPIADVGCPTTFLTTQRGACRSCGCGRTPASRRSTARH
jgi:leucyl aminopeptidase (aminopeptidase T)